MNHPLCPALPSLPARRFGFAATMLVFSSFASPASAADDDPEIAHLEEFAEGFLRSNYLPEGASSDAGAARERAGAGADSTLGVVSRVWFPGLAVSASIYRADFRDDSNEEYLLVINPAPVLDSTVELFLFAPATISRYCPICPRRPPELGDRSSVGDEHGALEIDLRPVTSPSSPDVVVSHSEPSRYITRDLSVFHVQEGSLEEVFSVQTLHFDNIHHGRMGSSEPPLRSLGDDEAYRVTRSVTLPEEGGDRPDRPVRIGVEVLEHVVPDRVEDDSPEEYPEIEEWSRREMTYEWDASEGRFVKEAPL